MKKKCKSNLPFSDDQLSAFIKRNRNSLATINDWIDNDSLIKSWYNYGIPDYIRSKINRKINSELTYSDLILFLSETYFDEINYLEIGVSVGKNFFQIINGLDKGKFTGFDIEEINPLIQSKFEFICKFEWQTSGKSIKKSNSSLSTYCINGNKVKYLSADVLDENSWQKLFGEKFNIIFSDALHTPEAIQFEFKQIVLNDLLANKFIIIWDDLEGEMEDAFYKIINSYIKRLKIEEIYLFKINGWIGEHEREHNVGLISNFKF